MLTQVEIDQIAAAAAQAVAKSVIEAVAKQIRAQNEAWEARLKTKFELVLAINCADEGQRDKARAAFSWLLAVDRDDIDETVRFSKDVRYLGRKGKERVFLWLLGLVNLALSAGMGWLISTIRRME